MSIQPHPQALRGNHLLSGLQVHEHNAVQRGSVVVTCAAGQILVDANTPTDHVFFPIDVVVSLMRTLDDGGLVELGLIGSDGMIGCNAFTETGKRLDAVVARNAGTVWCMPAEDFRRQFQRGGGLQKALLRFMNGFVSQLAQNATCNRFHSIEARLARWLLMIHDRNAEAEIDTSGSAIAGTLESEADDLDQALRALLETKAIRQRRSSVIVVSDAEALELRACDCYDSLRYLC